MKFTLNYVNLANETINYDREFDTLDGLTAFVKIYHNAWTSYQIIVVRLWGES